MPKFLHVSLISFLFLIILSSTTIVSAAQQTDKTHRLHQAYNDIFDNQSLTNKEKYQAFQTLSFNIDEKNHPQLAALIYAKLMYFAAIINDISAFNEWDKQLSTVPLEQSDQEVINFLVEENQMVLNREESQFIIAIAQGEKLKQLLPTFSIHLESNLTENGLALIDLDIALLYNTLGISYFSTSDFESAQKHYFKAMEIYQSRNLQVGMLSIYNNLSMISWAQQDYPKAISLLKQSIDIANAIKDEESVIRGQSNLGIYYSASFSYDNAFAAYTRVLKHKNINLYPKLKIQTLLAKSEVLQTIGEYSKSEQMIQEALLLSTQTQDQINLFTAKISLANLLKNQQKFEQALVLYNEALEQFRTLQMKHKELGVLSEISDLYRQQGNLEKSLEYFQLYNTLSIEFLKSAQKTTVLNLHEKFEKQNRDKQINLLEKANQLNSEAVKNAKDRQQFILYFSISLIIIIFLLLNRFYNRKHAHRLELHNKEIKENEKQLLLLSHAFSNTADAVWITNKDFEIEAVNNAFVLLCHKTRLEVLGKKVSFAPVKGQDEAFTKRVLLQAKIEGTWHGELYEQRSNDEIFPLELDIEAIRDEQNEIIHYLGVFRDITEQKKSQEQLERLVTHDDLTELPNRTLLDQLIKQSCLNSIYSGKTPTLLLLDVNGFKKISDSFGHACGDAIICEIAKRLKNKLYSKDVIGHINGAEFCILTELSDPKRSAARVAQKILTIFEQPFDVTDTPLNITASIGITLYPDDSDNAQDLLRKSAIAMLDVKNSDNHNYRFFERRMNNEVIEQLEREQRILNAINNQNFEYYYQPLVDTDTGRITGAEALIRWIESDGSIIAPEYFIPLAEQAGFIDQIDRITINTVFEQVASWHEKGQTFGNISINISAKMFSQSQELLRLLQAKLSQYRLNPALIKIEITESTLLHNIDQAIETMEQIKSLGFLLALDDFGTGFSSLNYLKRFPIDTLKIDRSFIMGMHESAVDQTIVQSIISLAHTLHLRVVGEGVELKEHLNELQKMHCEEYQGYLYSKPVPINEFEALFQSNTKLNK